MSNQQHPITPPPELVASLRNAAPTGIRDAGVTRELHLIAAAYAAGADQQKIRSGPESPLVERVADAIAAEATSAGIVNDRPARAAILQVAAWLREQHDGTSIAANANRASRIADLLQHQHPQPAAEGPTDEELEATVRKAEVQYLTQQGGLGGDANNMAKQIQRQRIAGFRAVLTRWGPTPQPVAVSERLPKPEDCTTNPRTSQGQWCWGWVQHDPAPYSGRWRMMRREWLADEATHWLPANAIPTPEATNG